MDMLNFTNLLNNTCENAKLDPFEYSDSVSLRLHRLLDFAPLGHRRPPDPLDDLVHLTLCAIMTTLMPEYGHNQARYDLLSEHIRRALHNYAAMTRRNDQLFLWALYVGNATVLKPNDDRWLTTLASESFRRSNLKAWSDIRWMLCQCGWICVFYDKMGTKLWGKITGAQVS